MSITLFGSIEKNPFFEQKNTYKTLNISVDNIHPLIIFETKKEDRELAVAFRFFSVEVVLMLLVPIAKGF